MHFGLDLLIICYGFSFNYLSEFRENFVCSWARHLILLFLVIFEVDVVKLCLPNDGRAAILENHRLFGHIIALLWIIVMHRAG